jgi:aspartate/methionine/tyrosine aminotransferase
MKPLAQRISELSGEGALSVFLRARELERQGRDIIHLELGEPDFHPAENVLAEAERALRAGQDRYCAPPGLPELQEAIAEYLARTRSVACRPGQVVVAPGCKMILSLTMTALIESGDEVLYPDPSFPIYPSLIRALGARPVAFGLREANGFQPDPDEIRRRLTDRAKVLILNSPNNPTGTVYSPEVLRELAAIAVERDLWVISDEIYARIVYDAPYVSISTLPGMAERTAIIDGFSKTFAMTGWRLGYAVAPAPLIPALHMLVVNTYTCASEFIQRAAIEALRDPLNAANKMVAEFAKRRDEFPAALGRIPGFRCLPPDGAFYAWVNIAGTGLPAPELAGVLLEEAGVAGIPGAAFGRLGEDFLRFSFASSAEQLRRAVERIAAVAPKWVHPATAASR